MKKSLSVVPHILALSLMAAFALPAAAQSAGSNVINVGWFAIRPHDSSETLVRTTPGPFAGPQAGSAAGVGGADTLGIAFTHFWTDNFATTLDAGIPPTFHLQGQGTLAPYGEIGSAKQWSPAVVAKWYFGAPTAQFRPFVGIGAAYIWYSDIHLSPTFQNVAALSSTGAGSASADLGASWSPVVNAGIAINLDDRWSINLSASYLRFKTDATINATGGALGPQSSRTTLTINPFVTFLSVGYKF